MSKSPVENKIILENVKPILKALKDLNPDFRKEMIREFKGEAKPLIEELKGEIQSLTPPIGSLNHMGRTSWNNAVYKGNTIKPDNVIARFSSGRSRKFAVTTLFGVWVRNPMVSITGVIGKGSMTPRKPVTREYPWRETTRSHTNNGQGRKLLAFVEHRQANWFYKTAEKALPHVEGKIKLVWDKYSSKVSRKL